MTTPDTGTALVRAAAETVEAKTLTVGQQKKFIELAAQTNLDKLPKEQQQTVLVAFGRHTGLRPELGEVMIYQGRFYVTIAGMRRNAHRNGLFMGRMPRPATKHERENAGYAEADIVWICDIWRRGCPQPFRGWGKVLASERKTANSHTPIAKHPVEIARKRAEYDGLRCAFPLDEYLEPFARQMLASAEDEIQKQGAVAVIAEATDAYGAGPDDAIASVETIEEAGVGDDPPPPDVPPDDVR